MEQKPKKIRNKDRTYAALREYKVGALTFETLDHLGAHSMGIGRKVVQGKASNQLALRIYVNKKLPSSKLSSEEEVPKSLRFFSRKAKREIDLITDVIETPPAHFEALDPETKIRPVPGGVSGGISGTTGTLGGMGVGYDR